MKYYEIVLKCVVILAALWALSTVFALFEIEYTPLGLFAGVSGAVSTFLGTWAGALVTVCGSAMFFIFLALFLPIYLFTSLLAYFLLAGFVGRIHPKLVDPVVFSVGILPLFWYMVPFVVVISFVVNEVFLLFSSRRRR